MTERIDPREVLSRAFGIYADQIGVLLPVALVIFLIEGLIALVLPGALAPFAALVAIAMSTFYQGMVVQLVRDVQDGRRDSSVAALLRSVTPVLLPLLAVSILFGIGVFAGFVLLVVPGLLALTFWAVAAPVTVLERPGILRAFGRSRELVRGHAWQVFAVIVFVFLLQLLVGLIAGAVGAGLGEVGSAAVQWVVNALVAPIVALAAAVLYFALLEARGALGPEGETAFGPAGVPGQEP